MRQMTMRFAIGLAAVAIAGLIATSAVAEPVKPVAFPQDRSDFKPEAETRYGRLANGMTYILRHNVTPPGETDVTLRIATGAQTETPRQRGLAHFLEHMAFEGSTHVPSGELQKILERHGFSFNADINAFTGPADTVYQLKAPKSDADSLDTTLFLLREVAENLTIAQADVDRERGVVLSELRLRDTPQFRTMLAFGKVAGPGLLAFDRLNVGGSTDIIDAAKAADLRQFYDAWYRPELATLVMAGDFDVDAMEAKIRAEFGGWQARAPAPDEPDWGHYAPGGERTLDHTDAGLTENMTVSWITPSDDRPDTQARQNDTLTDQFLVIFADKRLRDRTLSPDTALLSAGVQVGSQLHGFREVRLSLTPRPGKAKEAFAEALGVLESFKAGGLSPNENDQLRTLISQAENQFAIDDKTATSASRAASYVGGLRTDTVVKAPATAVAILEAARPHLIASAEMNARLKSWFDGDGPLLVHTGATASDYTAADMRADYDRLSTQTAATYSDSDRKPWPYPLATVPVPAAEHTTDADFGYARYVWPNGVVLKFKHTDFTASQILIDVAFPGGKAIFGPHPAVSPSLAQDSLLREGGLGKISYADMQKTLQRDYWSVAYSMADSATHLSGEGRLGELPIELAVLEAYTTDAALNPATFDRLRAATPALIAQIQATPRGTLVLNTTHLYYNDDPRFDNSALAHLDNVDYSTVQAMIRKSLSTGPIVITMVGDVPEANAVRAIGLTFGTLPARPASAPLPDGWDRIDQTLPNHDVTLHHQGAANQNLDVLRWVTADCHDIRAVRTLNVAAAIVRGRLFDTLRETDGADYAPSVDVDCGYVYKGDGHFQIQSTVRTGDDAVFRKDVKAILDDLRQHPPGADEFDRAIKPILTALDTETNTNGYWEGLISSLDAWPGYRANMLSRRADFAAITPADVSEAVKTWLRDDNLIHVEVVAEPAKTAH